MNPIERGQICQVTEQAIRHGTGRLSNVPGLISQIIDNRAWEEREVGPSRTVKLNSLLELITLPPFDGWGEDPKKIEALLKDDAESLAKWREAITQSDGGDRRSKGLGPSGDEWTLEPARFERLRWRPPREKKPPRRVVQGLDCSTRRGSSGKLSSLNGRVKRKRETLPQRSCRTPVRLSG